MICMIDLIDYLIRKVIHIVKISVNLYKTMHESSKKYRSKKKKSPNRHELTWNKFISLPLGSELILLASSRTNFTRS